MVDSGVMGWVGGLGWVGLGCYWGVVEFKQKCGVAYDKKLEKLQKLCSKLWLMKQTIQISKTIKISKLGPVSPSEPQERGLTAKLETKRVQPNPNPKPNQNQNLVGRAGGRGGQENM